MSSVKNLNPNAQVMGKGNALLVNVNAGKGLQNVLKSNLGPRGTLKMLVGGAGQIKITKDGRVLLHEMQIQHPTACMIARTATAQDDATGDGTTSVVLFIGELLQQAERFISQGVHPRIISDGFELAKIEALKFLETYKMEKPDILGNRDLLCSVSRTSLRTKLVPKLAYQLTDICTDAVLTITKPGEPIDLHMIERMHMKHRSTASSRLVRGLVLDHGPRHPDMPRVVENCFICIFNVSLEYEKTDVSSGFVYKNAAERQRMVAAERTFTDEKVHAVVALKRKVCTEENGKKFVIINQKGIDPLSLDILAKDGIMALRRAKRRNMERLSLACGGFQVNSVEDLTIDCLGEAGKVYEEVLGEYHYTIVEDVKNPLSCTILMKGPNPHSIAQLKDAVRDGTRSVKNAIDDLALVPGGGAFEIACHNHLMGMLDNFKGKKKLGVQAFAEAILVIPKTLAENSGLDVMDTLIALKEEYKAALKVSTAAADAAGATKSAEPQTAHAYVGLDVNSGEPTSPAEMGVWDNFIVKKQFVQLSTVIASQLLLVDELMRAGRRMGRK